VWILQWLQSKTVVGLSDDTKQICHLASLIHNWSIKNREFYIKKNTITVYRGVDNKFYAKEYTYWFKVDKI
jgi:hypothetical protein